jgi:hypothetical protein
MSSNTCPAIGNCLPLTFYNKSVFKGAFSTDSLEYTSALANEAERMKWTGVDQNWAQSRVLLCYHTTYPESVPQWFYRDHPIGISTGQYDRLGNMLMFYAMVRTTGEWVDTPGYVERTLVLEAHVTPNVHIDWNRTMPWPLSPLHSNYLEPHQFQLVEHRPIPLQYLPRHSFIYVQYSYEILNLGLMSDRHARSTNTFDRMTEICFLIPTTQLSTAPSIGCTTAVPPNHSITSPVPSQPNNNLVCLDAGYFQLSETSSMSNRPPQSESVPEGYQNCKGKQKEYALGLWSYNTRLPSIPLDLMPVLERTLNPGDGIWWK